MSKMMLAEIPEGIQGIRETLKLMRVLLIRAKRENTFMRDFASSLISDIPGKNWNAEIKAIFDYVRNNIRYQKDIVGIETVQTPEQTLTRGYGDCDDHALLAGALLECVGHPIRFMAVGFTPTSLIHVYCQALSGNPRERKSWISLDTTEPQPIGWEPPGIQNRLYIYGG